MLMLWHAKPFDLTKSIIGAEKKAVIIAEGVFFFGFFLIIFFYDNINLV